MIDALSIKMSNYLVFLKSNRSGAECLFPSIAAFFHISIHDSLPRLGLLLLGMMLQLLSCVTSSLSTDSFALST